MRHFLRLSGRGAGLILAGCFLTLYAQVPTELTDAQREQFLLNAKITNAQAAEKGITATVRVTLTDGALTHDASVQRIDESRRNVETRVGYELLFRDSWKYNLAAYKLDRFLGINMVPVTVERSYQGQAGTFTWWIDNVLMDEQQLAKNKTAVPNQDLWRDQKNLIAIFDQLIYNTDRTQANIIIDKNWRLWMIDHSRAFRQTNELLPEKVASLDRCEAGLLAKIKQLDKPTLMKLIGDYIGEMNVDAMIARRDKIVKIFNEKGPSSQYRFSWGP